MCFSRSCTEQRTGTSFVLPPYNSVKFFFLDELCQILLVFFVHKIQSLSTLLCMLTDTLISRVKVSVTKMLLHVEQTDRLSTCRRETCICCYHVSDLSRSPEIRQDPSTATPVAPTYSIYRLRKQSRGPTCQWPRTRAGMGAGNSGRGRP